MKRLKTRRTAHPRGSDTRKLVAYRARTVGCNGLPTVNAMLGRTLQEKQENRALATGQVETRSNRRDGGVMFT